MQRCATGFVLQVVEPHLNGPGGEMPAVFYSVERDEVRVLCGQGVAPAAATIERFHELGHELVPGTGVLAACVPGAFGAWLLLLREFGTWRLEDVLELAIGYAENGFPLARGVRTTIDRTEELLATWPGSRDLYLPAPEVRRALPEPGARARRTAASSRRAAAGRARRRSSGRGSRSTRALSPRRSTASAPPREDLLTGADLAAWEPTLEPAAAFDYRGLTVCKTGAWGTGPVALQQLALLQGYDLAELSRGRVRARRRPSARSSRSRTATRSTATRTCGSTSCSPRSTRTSDARSSAKKPRRTTGRDSADCPVCATRPSTVGSGEPEPRHRPSRHRRPLRKRALGDAQRGLAPELAGDPVAGLAARHAGADVLARGGAAVVAETGRAAANHALTRAGAPRRQAVPRLGNARRRPAGAVGAACVPPPCRPRPEPPGGDRRAGVPHRPPDLVLLPARLRAEVARARVAVELARPSPISSGEATKSRSGQRGRWGA